MRRHSALAIALTSAVALAVTFVFIFPLSFGSQSPSPAPQDFAGLQNVLAFHFDFYSGSAPKSENGFQSLDSLGIKTIISVDGAIPEVDLAAKYGMRYVHLPIGYDGFDDARKAQLVRAVRDLPKPIYLHCHHGKHRSAGAAGTVAVSLGWLTNEEATKRMKVCGTSSGYKGLWACTAAAAPMSAIAIDAASNDFPRITKPNSFVASMVAIDETLDRLRLAEKNGWKAPKDHPDLAPISDAGKLADLFRLIGEPTETPKSGAETLTEIRAWIAKEGIKSAELERMLDNPSANTSEISQSLAAIGASCKECHAKYRD